LSAAVGHPRLFTVHFFAQEWSLAVGKVCKMLEVLHPINGSQVGGGQVNFVAIGCCDEVGTVYPR